MASSNALSFCFGSGESIVTFPTVRPNKNQNNGPSATMFQAQQQQQSLNIYNRQFPKEIIGLIQSSRRTFLELQSDCNNNNNNNNSQSQLTESVNEEAQADGGCE